MNLAHPYPVRIVELFTKWLQPSGESCADIRRSVTFRAGGELQLFRSQVREVAAPMGVTVACLSGRVWITIDGDPRDVVLDPGEAFTVDRDQRTLVMALDEARFRCHVAASA